MNAESIYANYDLKRLFFGNHWELPSDTELLSHAREEFLDRLSQVSWLNEKDRDGLILGLDEKLENAMEHGNKYDLNKFTSVDLLISDLEIKIVIGDQGQGFVPINHDPLSGKGLLLKRGRGDFMAKNFFDEISYDFSKGGTEVTMIKRRSEPTG